jgi:2-polyprenyl-6-hydroxyphenyl methylase / 3-demethylubiquinone-9 3-methyltransferase
MGQTTGPKTLINNDFYDTLNEGWYTTNNHPIALLRAENSVRVPWIIDEIEKKIGNHAKVLDVGCGGGLLTNRLAEKGFDVAGIDLSESSLEAAKKYDVSKKVNYVLASAYQLPFPDHEFDVVCAMDILEHVEEPQQLIMEASRVLKKGGFFFFHTFNRNILSYLLVIKGVDWFIPNAPKNMHVYDLFIKPDELKQLCINANLPIITMLGFEPNLFDKRFWKALMTRQITGEFPFAFTNSLKTGYCGIAVKKSK